MSTHEDRIEKTLGIMTGDFSGDIPAPESRVEVLIQKLMNGGGSGSSGTSGLSAFPVINCYMEGTLISGVCDTDYADIVNEIENGRAVYSIVNIRLGDNVYTTVGISVIVANDEIVVSCLPDFNDSSANNYVTFIRPSLSISSDNSCFGVMARSELLKREEPN